MRTSLRTAALLTVPGLVITGALAAGPATAAQAATTEPGITWSPDLAAGEAAGVAVSGGTARLDPRRAFLAPPTSGGGAEGGADAAAPVPTGLLTLPVKHLPRATDRIGTAVGARGDRHGGASTADRSAADRSAADRSAADRSAATTSTGSAGGATVDVRGLRASGNWTEWVPAAAGGTVTLPERTTQVQARLVISGDPGPVVTSVTLRAQAAPGRVEAGAEAAPLSYRVFATREGLVGGTTANGHVITDHDHFVALPSRRALSPRDTSDYSVKVCAATGKCAFAPVWDVGPWNTRDDYWNPGPQREQWNDLPQGVPEAQAAFRDGYNGGKDQYGRTAVNPAGIDLGDGVFWDALGMKDNGTVTVDYLWTGDVRLAKVVGNAPVDVVAAPRVGAKVVGVAAEEAGVPVQCSAAAEGGNWLRIGTDQYVAAAAVPDAGTLAPCTS